MAAPPGGISERACLWRALPESFPCGAAWLLACLPFADGRHRIAIQVTVGWPESFLKIRSQMPSDWR